MLLNASLSSSNTGLEEAGSPLAPLAKDLACCSRACVSVYAKKTQNHLATMKFRLTEPRVQLPTPLRHPEGTGRGNKRKFLKGPPRATERAHACAFISETCQRMVTRKSVHGHIAVPAITTSAVRQRFDALLKAEHFRGPRVRVGERLDQVTERD